MATGDMAQFMRQHAFDLVGMIGRVDQARMHEYALASRNKGVDGAIVHKHDFHRTFTKTRRLCQRIDHVLQQRFGFRIAQNADALRHDGLRSQRKGSEEGKQPG